jgi:hypothetical protein
MIPVETISGRGKSSAEGEFKYNFIHYKNFCKCHNVLPLSTNRNKFKKYK